MNQPSALHEATRQSLEHYFATLDGQIPINLHAIVMQEVEQALFDFVMRRTGNNQSMSAKWLGINRNTLHKKIEQYGLLAESNLTPTAGELHAQTR
jgi:Fis family transcriptional regulator